MLRITRWITWLSFVAQLPVRQVFGLCSVPQPRSVCAELYHSDVVATANLVSVREVGEGAGYFYTLTARRVFRGQIPVRFRIWEENSSSRATFDWKLRGDYVLFLWYSKHDRAWLIDGCGNSGPLERSAAVVAAIRKPQNQRGTALVEGLASKTSTSVAPIVNVVVTAQGNGRTFTAITNKQGRFRLRLPPGTYRLVAKSRSFTFGKPELLSYENPNRLVLLAGSCAQVQFTADDP